MIYDLVNERFGRLKVIKRSGRKSSYAAWLCKCDCGNEKVVGSNKLRSGRTRSCGCLRSEVTRDRTLTHGLGHTPEYAIWHAMLQRCSDPNAASYQRYGGRGISVCSRWAAFENFYMDMGPRPSPGFSLERVNNDGDYDPKNCIWATRISQANNTRTNVRYAYKGQSLTIAEMSRLYGLDYMLIWHRLNRAGWPVHKAIETPPAKRTKGLMPG